jgi:hypothetical protein
MRFFRFAIATTLCCTSGLLVHCDDNSSGLAPQSSSQPSSSSTRVIPVPEVEQKYSSPTPVNAVVVDRNGNMTETRYTYDPDQGGVVINNYEEISGPGSSVFFPEDEVGLMWWDGFWVDHEGYYWNGANFVLVDDPGWRGRWDQYWQRDWRNKWNGYRQGRPNGRSGGGPYRANFDHRHGMNRPSHPPRSSGGGHGGRR